MTMFSSPITKIHYSGDKLVLVSISLAIRFGLMKEFYGGLWFSELQVNDEWINE